MNTDQLYEVYLRKPIISINSREITAGCMFFALKGEKVDGNLFAQKALDEGAAFAVIDNKKFKTDKRFIQDLQVNRDLHL